MKNFYSLALLVFFAFSLNAQGFSVDATIGIGSYGYYEDGYTQNYHFGKWWYR